MGLTRGEATVRRPRIDEADRQAGGGETPKELLGAIA